MNELQMSRLVELHGKKLYNFCLRLAKNNHDADDLYQDTFVKAMDKLSTIDENNNPSSYLCAIALSLWKSRTRKAARRHSIAPTVPIEETLHSVESAPPEESLVKRELHSEIREIIASLDEKLRVCTLLHYMYDMPLGEIARILNCPEGTVKSRLHTARQIIKEKMAKGAL